MAALEALAFDLYGTLVDPIRIWQQLERYLPEQARQIAEIWRQKQLEYSFRLTAMEQYEEFEVLTRKALEYALAAVGCELNAAQRAALVARYDDLERFADVEPGLLRLRESGRTMVIFSNGSPRMLEAVVDRAGLRPFFDTAISVHPARAFKPSPKVYRLVGERLGRPLAEIRLVSSNPFDVLGARAVGMQVAWIDRSGGLFDTLGPRPELVVRTIEELGEVLARRQ